MSAKRELTEEQKQAAEARRAKFRSLAKQLSQLSPAKRAEFAAKFSIVTIEGRALSPFNMCLVASQCPTATVVGGFKQWKKAGRSVRKGERGMSLWCPAGPRKAEGTDDAAEQSNDGPRFIMGCVFDVSQTDPMDKPADAPGYAARVEALEREGLTTSDAQGVADAELMREAA